MADKKEVGEAIKLLIAQHPERTLNADMLKTYVIGLEDIPDGYVNKAAVVLLKESGFFPRVAELRKQAMKMFETAGRKPADFKARSSEPDMAGPMPDPFDDQALLEWFKKMGIDPEGEVTDREWAEIVLQAGMS